MQELCSCKYANSGEEIVVENWKGAQATKDCSKGGCEEGLFYFLTSLLSCL
jgi:hypothetical protein